MRRGHAAPADPNDRDELDDDDDLGAGAHPAYSTSEQRKEDARQQRMNAEQRRRDQLRDGYDRLQSVLPQAREKLSKVKLIECGAFPPPPVDHRILVPCLWVVCQELISRSLFCSLDLVVPRCDAARTMRSQRRNTSSR